MSTYIDVGCINLDVASFACKLFLENFERFFYNRRSIGDIDWDNRNRCSDLIFNSVWVNAQLDLVASRYLWKVIVFRVGFSCNLGVDVVVGSGREWSGSQSVSLG